MYPVLGHNDTEGDMDDRLMVKTLIDLLENGSTDQDDTEEVLSKLQRVSTFEDELMMTSTVGLVIQCDEGSEFQVKVVQSKEATDG
jgi:hypothetical protein